MLPPTPPGLSAAYAVRSVHNRHPRWCSVRRSMRFPHAFVRPDATSCRREWLPASLPGHIVAMADGQRTRSACRENVVFLLGAFRVPRERD